MTVAGNKNYILLVADDEPILRNIIGSELAKKGFQVVPVENGTEALDLVKQHKIDLVISDIRMPHGDGITLLDNIQKLSSNKPAVILMTGFADITEQECLKKGAFAVIQKPFQKSQLLDLIQKVLESQKS